MESIVPHPFILLKFNSLNLAVDHMVHGDYRRQGNKGNYGHQLDEDVHRRTGRILEGIADCVADNTRLVRIGTLAAEVALFNIFFALSQAPPELAIRRPSITPVSVAPARNPPKASGPIRTPTKTGLMTAATPGRTILFKAAVVAMSTQLFVSEASCRP
jgi:hypothetical protein